MSPNTKHPRAVGYSRTSGEAQRDNTSIPSQQAAIESFCQRQGMQFSRHYVDECKSGAKVAGRDAFQQLMKDGAAGKFTIAVVYQVSRWGRDGADIIESARTLQRDFGISVVETAGSFDTRDPTKVLVNFVGAGVAEHERLMILQRTMGGRIAQARAGQPWCGAAPAGRAWDKALKEWRITDHGRDIADMLKRYAQGESVTILGEQFAKAHGRTFKKHYFKTWFSKWVHDSQLAGPYTIHFRSPDIGLDEKVIVPGIPEVVSPALLAKVKARLAHNTRFNRSDAKQYLLSGFIYCAKCHQSLVGQTTSPEMHNLQYYRHDVAECPAPWMSVRGEKLTAVVLDYLYGFFLDEPAFNKAVKAALPSTDHRNELTRQRDSAAKRLAKTDKEIARLVDAITQGADVGLLLSRQDELKAEQAHHQQEVVRLDEQLAAVPSAEQLGQAATWLRLDLIRQHRGKDWRKLSHDEVKRFLHHLLGDNPKRTGTGIFVNKDSKGNITATFKGLAEIPHTVAVVDGHGRVVSPALTKEAQRLSRQLKGLLKPVTANFRFSTE